MKKKNRIEVGKTYHAETGLSTEYDRLFDAVTEAARQLGYTFILNEYTTYDTLGRPKIIETVAILSKNERPPK